jgi:hypothetical protein
VSEAEVDIRRCLTAGAYKFDPISPKALGGSIERRTSAARRPQQRVLERFSDGRTRIGVHAPGRLGLTAAPTSTRQAAPELVRLRARSFYISWRRVTTEPSAMIIGEHLKPEGRRSSGDRPLDPEVETPGLSRPCAGAAERSSHGWARPTARLLALRRDTSTSRNRLRQVRAGGRQPRGSTTWRLVPSRCHLCANHRYRFLLRYRPTTSSQRVFAELVMNERLG